MLNFDHLSLTRQAAQRLIGKGRYIEAERVLRWGIVASYIRNLRTEQLGSDYAEQIVAIINYRLYMYTLHQGIANGRHLQRVCAVIWDLLTSRMLDEQDMALIYLRYGQLLEITDAPGATILHAYSKAAEYFSDTGALLDCAVAYMFRARFMAMRRGKLAHASNQAAIRLIRSCHGNRQKTQALVMAYVAGRRMATGLWAQQQYKAAVRYALGASYSAVLLLARRVPLPKKTELQCYTPLYPNQYGQ